MRSFNIAVLVCLVLLFTDFAVCEGDSADQLGDSSDRVIVDQRGDSSDGVIVDQVADSSDGVIVDQRGDSSDGGTADQLGDSSDGGNATQVADSSDDNGSNSTAQVDTDNTKENPAVITAVTYPSNSTDATRNDTDGTTEEERDQPAEGDDLNDDATVLKPDAISDASDNGVHTVKLMLYIIAPISALVVIYFIMKGLRGNSRMFLNRYHVVAGTDDKDNIELRPLELSDEEDDVVFESSRLT